MPPSQLKRLKSSLREQGITGPQKSKKQKKDAAKGKSSSDRVARNAALQQIRDSFNPFEVKAPSRPSKFEHTTINSGKGPSYRDVLHRPGVSKSVGEEMRRATLLPEMQRRNKTGALVDRRIGEGDPGMTAEERAVQRFAREKSRKKGANLFDLEASDDEPGLTLTHGGRPVGELAEDDFGQEDISGSESDDGELMRRKRRREDEADEERAVAENGEVQDEQPERKKSKKEVMEEVIAKSKLHKYERQKAKEDDDDLRDLLDQGTGDMLALLRGYKVPQQAAEQQKTDAPNGSGPTMNPERQKLLDGQAREKVDKEYDSRLRELARDTRAKPSERTKTEEEKVREEAERLRALEERRMKRMRGEEVSDDEHDVAREDAAAGGPDDLDDTIPDQAAEFGFRSVDAPAQLSIGDDKIVLDEEDDFDLDEDLVASDSDADLSSVSASDEGSDAEQRAGPDEPDEEDEFVKDILGDEKAQPTVPNGSAVVNGTGHGLSYTYPCPQNHEELLQILKDDPPEQLPTIIQRIRALHHPSLSASNKESTASFSTVLVEHLAYMGNERQPFTVSEQVIRHLHSLSRTYPHEIATAFRSQLAGMHERKGIGAGDCVVLTAIGSIYPTSDHFHPVVTPAMTIMCRWLGMNAPETAAKHNTGAFVVGLTLQYQRLSKRYVPEAVRFTLRALTPASKKQDVPPPEQRTPHVANLFTMAHLWKYKPAFTEIFNPFVPVLKALGERKAHQTISILLSHARTSRRPLTLHHHRPQPIRTSIPKFEDGFHPDKHYDPDKERSEAAKLRREHKREKKGALRELRKDANFVAREQLREKRERDAEYERKYRRLVASVQAEEGHEAKEYEKAKAARKRAKTRG